MLCFKPLHFNHLEKTIKRYHIILKANSSILKIKLTSELRIILSGEDRDPLISTVERDCLEWHLFLTESPSSKQSQNYNHATTTGANLASNIVEYNLTHTFHGISKRLNRKRYIQYRDYWFFVLRLALAGSYAKLFRKKISVVKSLKFQASFADLIRTKKLKQTSRQRLNYHSKVVKGLHEKRYSLVSWFSRRQET